MSLHLESWTALFFKICGNILKNKSYPTRSLTLDTLVAWQGRRSFPNTCSNSTGSFPTSNGSHRSAMGRWVHVVTTYHLRSAVVSEAANMISGGKRLAAGRGALPLLSLDSLTDDTSTWEGSYWIFASAPFIMCSLFQLNTRTWSVKFFCSIARLSSFPYSIVSLGIEKNREKNTAYNYCLTREADSRWVRNHSSTVLKLFPIQNQASLLYYKLRNFAEHRTTSPYPKSTVTNADITKLIL